MVSKVHLRKVPKRRGLNFEAQVPSPMGVSIELSFLLRRSVLANRVPLHTASVHPQYPVQLAQVLRVFLGGRDRLRGRLDQRDQDQTERRADGAQVERPLRLLLCELGQVGCVRAYPPGEPDYPELCYLPVSTSLPSVRSVPGSRPNCYRQAINRCNLFQLE